MLLDLLTRFYWLFIILASIIGIIGSIALGVVFYFIANKLLDRFQQAKRRPMATKMTPHELLRARQRKSAVKKAAVIDENLRVHTYDWSGISKR